MNLQEKLDQGKHTFKNLGQEHQETQQEPNQQDNNNSKIPANNINFNSIDLGQQKQQDPGQQHQQQQQDPSQQH